MPSVLRPNHKFLASSVKSEWSLSIFLHCDPSAGCLNFLSFLRSSLCHRCNLACYLFLNRRFNHGIIGAYHITLAGTLFLGGSSSPSASPGSSCLILLGSWEGGRSLGSSWPVGKPALVALHKSASSARWGDGEL